jgi:tetratricopeptide (TPR) repeat protein
VLTSQDKVLRLLRRKVWPRLSAGWGGAVIVSAILAAASLAIYAQAWQGEFLEYDDQFYVTRNYNLDRGFSLARGFRGSGLEWALTTDTAHNWHPATWLSHMLDVRLFGRDPKWHHGVNVLLHAMNSALVFLVWRSLTGRVWPSALVAALWAVHPINVESVAWVAERKNVLSMFFLLLTLGAYGAYARRGGIGRYLLVSVLLALGLLSKSMLVTLPCAMLLLDYWPLRRMRGVSGGPLTDADGVLDRPARSHRSRHRGVELRTRSTGSGRDRGYRAGSAAPRSESGATPTAGKPLLLSAGTTGQAVPSPSSSAAAQPRSWWWLVLEKLPWFAMAVFASQMTLRAQVAAQAELSALPLGARVANALVSDAVYLWQLVCPLQLSPMYLHPQQNVALWKVIAAGVFLVAVTALVIWQWRRRPYLFVGWFWYLGTLVPVSGLVQVGLQGRADRYLYLPAIGIFVMVSWLLAEFVRHRPAAFWPAAIGSGIVLGSLAGLTVVQVGYWHDLGTLFRRALEIDPNNAFAHYNVGVSLREKGQHASAAKHFQEATKLAPIAIDAQLELAGALARDGRIDEAEKILDAQLRLSPDSEMSLLNRAMVLIEKGDLTLAAADCQRVLEINPKSFRALIYLGVISARRGDNDQAARYLDDALSMDPQNSEAQINAGLVAQARKDLPAALKYLRRATEVAPSNALAWYTYGMMLAAADDRSAGIDALERVVALDPKRASVHFQLGQFLVEEDRASEALVHFRTALELTRNTPDWPLVANTTAWLLATHPSSSVRNGREAVDLAQQACQQTTFGNPNFLDTLAAAYAEAGKFAEAVAYANKAYDAAFDANQLGLAADIKVRWRFYENERPYHAQQQPQ